MRKAVVDGVLGAVSVLLLAACSTQGQGTAGQGNDVPVAETGLAPPPVARNAEQRTTYPRAGSGAATMDHSQMQGMDHSQMQGMDHSQMQGTAEPAKGGHAPMHGAHGMEHGKSAAGSPGQPAQVTLIVRVTASDTMRFDPQELRVKAGETVRFDIVNTGKVPHEFMIGSPEEQAAHEKMMQQMPGMKHEDENVVSLAPGERRTLVWRFDRSGIVEIGCHVPGHYPAGMKCRVVVGAADGQSTR